jgi:hypothetical protein
VRETATEREREKEKERDEWFARVEWNENIHEPLLSR